MQTCRGSHTHTLVRPKNDANNVYIYVSGTAGTVRAGDRARGLRPRHRRPTRTRRSGGSRSSRSRSPRRTTAAIVNEPRLFRDETTGAVNGLQNAPQTPLHPSGMAWGPTPDTNSCHDITVYEKLDLAAGSCEGNGLLIDISDPANPKRIDAVADPLFAYWHGATFSNDGKKVFFTDEWGGGTAARCRATDQLSWGANAIYEIVNRKLVFKSYYKLPVAQTTQENCVSHLPSLVPIPGRDIFVQAWYQGGASLVDFTELVGAEGDRLLRPWPDQRDRARARRLLVDLLVQRRDLRLGDRPRLRLVRPHADRRPVGGRDRRGQERRPGRALQRAEPGPVRLPDVGAGPDAGGRQRAGDAVADARRASVVRCVHAGRGPRRTTATTSATVTSSAGDALLSVADPSSLHTNKLVNGSFFLPQPLQSAGSQRGQHGHAYNNVGSRLAAEPVDWSAPTAPTTR